MRRKLRQQKLSNLLYILPTPSLLNFYRIVSSLGIVYLHHKQVQLQFTSKNPCLLSHRLLRRCRAVFYTRHELHQPFANSNLQLSFNINYKLAILRISLLSFFQFSEFILKLSQEEFHFRSQRLVLLLVNTQSLTYLYQQFSKLFLQTHINIITRTH